MTKAEHEKLVEQAIHDYAREMKEDRDRDTVAGYYGRLKNTKKHYSKSAEAFSTGGQKGRAMAIGACVLELLKALQKDAVEKKYLPGTLSWLIDEQRVIDPDGKKGYKYTVVYHAYADEQAVSDEEIKKEIEELTEKLRMETEEMFGEAEAQEEAPAEEPLAEVKDTEIQ